MPATRTLDFLDGTSFTVDADTCRGCFMNEREDDLTKIIAPILDDGVITVRQDAEWPVPGFMVIGIRPHIGSIGDMSLDLAHRVTTVMHVVRRGMRDLLDLNAVQTYQEEKLERPHFHVWMLPLWKEIMDRYAINPRIYESNVTRYLTLFDYRDQREAILSCAAKLRAYLRDSELLRREGLLPKSSSSEHGGGFERTG